VTETLWQRPLLGYTMKKGQADMVACRITVVSGILKIVSLRWHKSSNLISFFLYVKFLFYKRELYKSEALKPLAHFTSCSL